MHTYRRRFYPIAISGVLVAALIVLFLILGTGDWTPKDPPPVEAPVTELEGEAVEVAVTPVAAPVATEEAVEVAIEAEIPEENEIPEDDPSLRGVVSGGSGPIPEARVLLFSFGFVELMIRRLERLATNASPTDIPRIITTIKKELNSIRDAGVEARTNAYGEYAFFRLAPGSYFVLVIAQEYVFDYGDVVAIQKDVTAEHHVFMQRGETIAGRVVDTNADAVTGARVLAVFRPPGVNNVGKIVQKILQYVNGEFLRGPFEDTTDADGRFEIPSLPPGLYDLVATEARFPQTSLDAVLSGTTEAVVVLRPGRSGVGKLVDGQGAAVVGKQVRLGAERLPTFLPMPGGAEMIKAVERIVDDPDRLTPTNSDGEFRFDNVTSGRFVLEVDVNGYLPVRKSVQTSTNDDKEASTVVDVGEIRLDIGETIAGVVRDDFGATVEGASIVVFAQRGDMSGFGSSVGEMLSGKNQVTADGYGKFVVAGLGPGKYFIVAEAAGHGRARERGVAAGSQDIELVLKRGVDILGEVRDAKTDEPLREVDVYGSGGRTKTDADGEFVLKSVGPRRDFDPFGGGARRRRPGGQENEDNDEPQIKVRFSSDDYESEERMVPMSEVNQKLKVSLRRRSTITGQVLDPDGEPLVGAMLRLVPGESDAPFMSSGLLFVDAGVSKLDGEFKLKPIEADGSYFVLASHPLYATTPGEEFTIADGKADKNIEVRMVPPALVHGKVSDGSEGVAGVTMRLAPARDRSPTEEMFMKMFGMPEEGPRVIANSEGQFHFERILPGDYVLTARTRGYGETRSEKISVGEGEEREVDILLDPGGEIAGKTLTIDGDPLPGVRVRLIRANAVSLFGSDDGVRAQKMFGGFFKMTSSGSDGSFEFESVPDGQYALVAEKSGHVSQEVPSVTPGEDSEVEIILEESARLSGVVVNGATGQPLAEFEYRLIQAGDEDPEFAFMGPQWEFVKDGSGTFAIKDLAPGIYTVDIRAQGYLPIGETVALQSGEAREIRMVLARAGKLEGTVVDAQTGEPVGGVEVRIGESEPKPSEEQLDALHARLQNDPREILSEGWPRDGDVRTNASGVFEVENYPEGEHDIVFAHPSYVSDRRPGITIESGDSLSLNIILRKGLDVSGTIRNSAGQPIERALVVLRGTAEGNLHVRQSTRSEADGSFQVSGLVGGRYVVAARTSRSQGELSRVTSEVDLVDGGVEAFEITVPLTE